LRTPKHPITIQDIIAVVACANVTTRQQRKRSVLVAAILNIEEPIQGLLKAKLATNCTTTAIDDLNLIPFLPSPEQQGLSQREKRGVLRQKLMGQHVRQQRVQHVENANYTTVQQRLAVNR
jgi:hypothetical protein